MKNIAIIGAGTMGHGIAHLLAENGFNVTLIDHTEKGLKYGLEQIAARADQKTLNHIAGTTTMQAAADADLVIEAVVENLSLKKKIFQQLDKICKKNAILATNTSSLSITKLAAATKRPQKIIGMHFMNPPVVMKLVEIIIGSKTSKKTLKAIIDLTKKLKKIPATVKDSPGFISNRVLMIMINEAIYALHEGIATKEDIDSIMTNGMHHPMGPLTLADFIGLDVCLDIIKIIYKKNKKFKPCPLLIQKVKAKKLGRKTGEGFYKY